jgi:hypothetical protein
MTARGWCSQPRVGEGRVHQFQTEAAPRVPARREFEAMLRYFEKSPCCRWGEVGVEAIDLFCGDA